MGQCILQIHNIYSTPTKIVKICICFGWGFKLAWASKWVRGPSMFFSLGVQVGEGQSVCFSSGVQVGEGSKCVF